MAIVLLGLGPGDPNLLTIEAQRILASASEIWLRTERHPAASYLPAHLTRHSFDALYDSAGVASDAAEVIAERVLALGLRPEGVIYAVPGHPLVGEAPSRLILSRAEQRGASVQVVAGLSTMEAALAALGVDPLERGLQILDALEVRVDPALPALIAHIQGSHIAGQVQLRLLEQYPEDHEIAAVSADGAGQQRVQRLALNALDSQAFFDHLICIYVPPLTPEQALGSFSTLEHLVARLRAPDGCPWDRAQTHESLKADLLEEVYETLAALDARDPSALKEELGDLLLHVAFHADIATKAGEFTWHDLLGGLASKLIRRHPHVFGGETIADVEDVLHRWEALKQVERPDAPTLASLPHAMPALAYSQAAQERVRRVGFDWPDLRGPLDKLAEELIELEETSDADERVVEFGDILFNVVNIALHLGINAEEALRRANDKFVKRYTLMEAISRQRGLAFSSLTLDQMMAFWGEAKAQLQASGEPQSKPGN